MSSSVRKSTGVQPLVLVCAALFSCHPSAPNEAKIQSIISQQQLQRADAIVDGLDYLPFEFLKDGCGARAYYIGMELAAEAIPSSVLYVFPTDEDRPLLRPNGGIWDSYHVASMVQTPDGSSLILDPPVSQNPIDQAAWLRAMGDVPVQQVLRPASNLNTPASTDAPIQMVQAFAELPPFRFSEVGRACGENYRNLDRTPQQEAAAPQRREKLVARTLELLEALTRQDKLIADTNEIFVYCDDEPLRLPH